VPTCPICDEELHPYSARRYRGCCSDTHLEIRDLREVEAAARALVMADNHHGYSAVAALKAHDCLCDLLGLPELKAP
jgi:hypothetical protein